MWTARFSQEALSCPVCYETFANPRVLACGHTLCAACVDQLRVAECPMCRRAIEGPPPPNVVVEDLLALVSEYERVARHKRRAVAARGGSPDRRAKRARVGAARLL